VIYKWAHPLCCTRTGAAHLRKGKACQDFSISRMISSCDKVPVMVMGVADGHGSQRYWLSHEGSRLACEIAIDAIESFISHQDSRLLSKIDAYQQWLAVDLPAVIHSKWLTAIQLHWHNFHYRDGIEFNAETYGTTLGLVVMTPYWWGHTGVGDWDLVLIPEDGSIRLVSEENDVAAVGESTFSLCKGESIKIFSRRAGIYSLNSPDLAFKLVLSTDGIRKSCSTDADYFTLVGYLAKAILSADQDDEFVDLPSSLDRITKEGSGDDVSIVVGKWQKV